MLSESERRVLADLEASLRDDSDLVATSDRHSSAADHPYRTLAVWLAGVATVVIAGGLFTGNIPGVVVAICSLAVAAALWVETP